MQTLASWALIIIGMQEVDVIGGHHGQAKLFGERNLGVDAVLITGPASPLQFQVEGIGEQRRPMAGPLLGEGLLTGEQCLAYIPMRAPESIISPSARDSIQSRSTMGRPVLRPWV